MGTVRERARRGAAGTGVLWTEALLFGATEALHDYHAGPGSFRATIAALRSHGARVSTPVTRSNFRHLGELPPLMSGLKVSFWRLAVVAPSRDPDPVAPRLAMAAPHILRALARAEAAGLQARVAGLPLCLMGPYADRSLPPATAAGERCRGCPAAADCSGVAPSYLDRFGDAELRRRPAVRLRQAPPELSPLIWSASDLP